MEESWLKKHNHSQKLKEIETFFSYLYAWKLFNKSKI